MASWNIWSWWRDTKFCATIFVHVLLQLSSITESRPPVSKGKMSAITKAAIKGIRVRLVEPALCVSLAWVQCCVIVGTFLWDWQCQVWIFLLTFLALQACCHGSGEVHQQGTCTTCCYCIFTVLLCTALRCMYLTTCLWIPFGGISGKGLDKKERKGVSSVRCVLR